MFLPPCRTHRTCFSLLYLFNRQLTAQVYITGFKMGAAWINAQTIQNRIIKEVRSVLDLKRAYNVEGFCGTLRVGDGLDVSHHCWNRNGWNIRFYSLWLLIGISQYVLYTPGLPLSHWMFLNMYTTWLPLSDGMFRNMCTTVLRLSCLW